MEDKTARFTILIDADRKREFEALCAAQDVTASQMIRRLMREYLSKHGVDPGDKAKRPGTRRKTQ
jgi:hypothetical protein